MMSASSATVRSLEDSRLAPASTVELSHVIGHWLAGERAWARELCERLDAGHYRFAGDLDGPDLPVEGVWPPAVLASPKRG
jgi:hypothetical protein